MADPATEAWMSQLDVQIAEFERIRTTFISPGQHNAELVELRTKLQTQHNKIVNELRMENEALHSQMLSKREGNIAQVTSLEGQLEALKVSHAASTAARDADEAEHRARVTRLTDEANAARAAALAAQSAPARAAKVSDACVAGLRDENKRLHLQLTALNEELALAQRSQLTDRQAFGALAEERTRLREDNGRLRGRTGAAEARAAKMEHTLKEYKTEARDAFAKLKDRESRALQAARRYRDDYEAMVRQVNALRREVDVLR